MQELFTREGFVEYMVACDELVATSDDAQFYLDLFSILMVEERFLPPTDRHFSASVERAKHMRLTIDGIEKGIGLTMAVSGPNEALPNVFVAYEFLTCVCGFARHAAGKAARRDSQRRRVEKRCQDVRQLAILTFLLAIKVQLGLESPDCWQRPVQDAAPEPSAQAGSEIEAPSPAAAASEPAEPSPTDSTDATDTPHMKLVEAAETVEPGSLRPPRDCAKERAGWTIWNSTNLLGKANMILAWDRDGETDSWEADKHWLRDGMKVVRRLIEDKDTSKFSSGEWFCRVRRDRELSRTRRGTRRA